MSLLDVWQAAASNPFQPTIAKEHHFIVGSSLLLIGMPDITSNVPIKLI